MIYLFVVVASLVAGLQAAPLSDRQPPVAMSDQLQPASLELLHLVAPSDCSPDCTTEVWDSRVHGKAPGTTDVWQSCGTRIKHRKKVEFGFGRVPIILACAAVAHHYPNCSACMPAIQTFSPPESPPSPPVPPSKPPQLSPVDWGLIHALNEPQLLPAQNAYLDHTPSPAASADIGHVPSSAPLPAEELHEPAPTMLAQGLQVLWQDPARGVHILRKEVGRLLASGEAA